MRCTTARVRLEACSGFENDEEQNGLVSSRATATQADVKLKYGAIKRQNKVENDFLHFKKIS